MSWVRGWVAVGVTLAGVALVAACGRADVDAGAAGGAVASAGECRTDTTPTGTDEPEGEPPNTVEELTDLRQVPELPPPTIPGNVSPPTTEVGEDPIDGDPIDPFDPNSETIPALGGFRVDPTAFGCVDFAVHLDQYEDFRIRSWGDSGIYAEVQVFSPSGQQLASWDTGVPDSFEGYEWEDPGLPEVGTYVVRTVHRGGSHNAFVLIFYGNPPPATSETSVTTAPS